MAPGEAPDAAGEAAHTVEVTALGINGQAVVGPVALAEGSTVREVRSRVLDTRTRRGIPVRAVLLDGAREVEDTEQLLGPGPLTFFVLFREFEPLEAEERERFVGQALDARRTPDALRELPEAARADEAVVLEFIAWHAESFRYANEVLRYDAEFQCKATTRNGRVLRYADDVVANDVEVVRRCVATDGMSLRFAGKSLTSDRSLVLLALASDSAAIEFAAEALRGDPAVVLPAVLDNGHHLQHAAPPARCDREVVCAAVRTDPLALQHAPEAFGRDLTVLLEAIRARSFREHMLLQFLELVDLAMLCDEVFVAELCDVIPGAPDVLKSFLAASQISRRDMSEADDDASDLVSNVAALSQQGVPVHRRWADDTDDDD